jgi:hypothetical protein
MPRYYVVLLTLTVADNLQEIGHEHLHRVMTLIKTRLKRAGADLIYIAVKETQERGAIHYHVLCIYDKPYLFPSSEDIAKSWGLGFVKISAPKLRIKLKKIVGYLGKYIGKGYEYEALDCKKSFTASQIKQIYKLSPARLAEVIRRFGKSMAEQFKCTYRKVFMEGYIENEILRNKVHKQCRDLIMEFPSEWVYEGVFDEAF